MWRPNLLYWAERSKSEFKLKLYRLCCHGRAGGEESEDKLLFSPRGRSLILLRLQQRSGRKVPPQRKVPGLLEASSPVIKCWPFALVAPTFLSAQWKIQTWRNTAGYQSGCPVSDCFDQGDSRHDIKELKKFVQIMGPMERIFRQLNSELESTIHLCYPFVKVDNLFWVVYISIYLLQDMLESLKPRMKLTPHTSLLRSCRITSSPSLVSSSAKKIGTSNHCFGLPPTCLLFTGSLSLLLRLRRRKSLQRVS